MTNPAAWHKKQKNLQQSAHLLYEQIGVYDKTSVLALGNIKRNTHTCRPRQNKNCIIQRKRKYPSFVWMRSVDDGRRRPHVVVAVVVGRYGVAWFRGALLLLRCDDVVCRRVFIAVCVVAALWRGC